MNYLSSQLLILIALVPVISGCFRKNNEGLCSKPFPSIISNSPVAYGGTIELRASDYPDVEKYSWRGPNGFTSSEKTVSIPNCKQKDEGEYSFEMTLAGDCESDVVKSTVAVSLPTAPCVLDDNSFTLSNTPQSNLYNFYFMLSNFIGHYIISANALNSYPNIKIVFLGIERPKPGIYIVTPAFTSTTQEDEVTVQLYLGGAGYWDCTGGLVYITETAGKLNAKYCDLNFVNTTVAGTRFGSAMISEP